MEVSIELPELLLRTESIRPGDVLLSRGGGKKSKKIAGLSVGRFSHAAILINRSMIFESDGEIIGYKSLRYFGWARLGDSESLVAALPGDPTDATLYRHPDIEGITEEHFKKALEDELADSYGKDYSERYRLIRLAEGFPESLKSIVTLALRLYETRFSGEQIPGPFCSELVARFYKRLELPLFSESRLPENISPNHLARSNLRTVQTAVFRSEGVEVRLLDQQNRFEGSMEDPYPPGGGDKLAFLKRELRKSDRASEQFSQQFASISKANKEAILRMLLQQMARVQYLIDLSQNVNRLHAVRRVGRLCAVCVTLFPDLIEIAEMGPLELRKMYAMLDRWEKLGTTVLRNEVLFASESVKDAANKSTGSLGSIRRFRLRKQRKRVLRLGRKAIAERLQLHRRATLLANTTGDALDNKIIS